jgi:hypothetical protein
LLASVILRVIGLNDPGTVTFTVTRSLPWCDFRRHRAVDRRRTRTDRFAPAASENDTHPSVIGFARRRCGPARATVITSVPLHGPAVLHRSMIRVRPRRTASVWRGTVILPGPAITTLVLVADNVSPNFEVSVTRQETRLWASVAGTRNEARAASRTGVPLSSQL